MANNSDNTVYAQGNYWKTAGSQDAQGIEDVIYHRVDDASLGEVVFTPWLENDPSKVHGSVVDRKQDDVVFDLNGVRRDKVHKGVNIVTRRGKTVKVVR